MKEALIEHALEEVENTVSRVEALISSVSTTEQNFKEATNTLIAASDEYKLTVIAFTEQAKKAISDHVQLSAARARTEIIASMEEAATTAFKNHASEKSFDLASTLTMATLEFKRAQFSRIKEATILALVSSLLTATLVYLILRTP